MTKHYLETTKEIQKRLNSTGHYIGSCLCGNGSYHAIKTRDKDLVNCPKCLEKLGR